MSTAPRIELRQLSVRRSGPEGSWEILWQVENTGASSLTLKSARLPHGQFKSTEQRFEPAFELAPAGAAKFTTQVFCDEAAGLVTENAFVIFSVIWLGEEWRIFVRVRIFVTSKGEPESATELITTQKVGFSGVPN
jgi:hypothetical protein